MSFWKGCKTKCVSASTEHQCIAKPPPTQVFKYLLNRQYGSQRNQQTPIPEKIVSEFVTQQIPGLLEEKEYNMGKINKIFSAKWLNNNQIAIGTKCNKLLILDVNTGRILNIPSLKSSDKSYPSECPCGIHSIDINPSQTLLATGAENTNDLAVYKLPTFDPVMVGEGGHSDWIFDMKWLDDEFIVTASRDSKLSLWKVDEVENSDISGMLSLQIPEYRTSSFIAQLKQCRKLPHTRENVCMTCCKDKVLYAVGSQSHINLVDPRSPNTLTTVISRYRGGVGSHSHINLVDPRSPNTLTTVISRYRGGVLYAVGSQSHINVVDPRSPNTLTTVISGYRGGVGSQSHNNVVDPGSPNTLTTVISRYRGGGLYTVLYAVGSQSHINVVDPRSPNTLSSHIIYRGRGIRSLSFKEDVLTIGTGVGHVLFFDIKAGKYFDCNCGHACTLNVGHGWLLHDENYREYFMDHNYPNAIYTHEYDQSGTRLFTAGGPLPAGLWGNYAGLWW
ncbi:hypothetical protein KUTeg_018411 [Tegillarca granosa]|uniref:DDB1- and CUL4-associated factor 12 beta-propeller domain-containing protein n=1 Tax=Tegillarca granosa TaxID=220873 RepID=A0ABQ9ENK9_TEGGR|nr:hypothetical protein KUTeg_018411 [Tegillarca granosa]